MVLLIDKYKIDTLSKVICHKQIYKLLINGFTGTTIKHISKEYLKNLDIPVPSLHIQQQLESDY